MTLIVLANIIETVSKSKSFWSNLSVNLLAGFLFLVFYEFVFRNLFFYFRNRQFIGHYIHCNINYNEIKTGTKTHNSDISINFFRPNVINIKSTDYSRNEKREWTGKIKLDSETGLFGLGTYKYKNETTMGIHDILVIDKDTISFQLTYYKQTGSPYLLVKEKSDKIIKVE